MSADTLSKAYAVTERFADLAHDGNDRAKSLKLLARAALVTLARERSSSEAANFAQSMHEELRIL